MSLHFWERRCIACHRRKPTAAFTYMVGGSIERGAVCRACFERRMREVYRGPK